MRTTLNLDEDVLDLARSTANRMGKPFRQIVNESIRLGLKLFQKNSQKRRPYHTKARALKLQSGYSLDNIQELLSRVEGEDSK